MSSSLSPVRTLTSGAGLQAVKHKCCWGSKCVLCAWPPCLVATGLCSLISPLPAANFGLHPTSVSYFPNGPYALSPFSLGSCCYFYPEHLAHYQTNSPFDIISGMTNSEPSHDFTYIPQAETRPPLSWVPSPGCISVTTFIPLVTHYLFVSV